MNDTALTTIAATGFTVAFFHAAIPTHWLPFVLVGRAREWPAGKTIAVALAAGLGHVALTSLLGLGIAWTGFKLGEEAGEMFPKIAGGILLLIAAYYFWRQFSGKGVLHHHAPGGSHSESAHCGHGDDHTHFEDELRGTKLVTEKASDWPAIAGLFMMLTLSPCEGFLPVYLSAVQYGWRGFWLLSAILAVATLAGMLLFTTLTLRGFERLRLQRFERIEAGLLGTMFAVLALLVLFAEHGHAH
jgi:ABC-type nickel/cobalt efflux system permease component RcnA